MKRIKCFNELISNKFVRLYLAFFIGILILIQIFLLHHFLDKAFDKGNIIQLEWLFLGLFGGIMAQLIFLVRLVFRWFYD